MISISYRDSLRQAKTSSSAAAPTFASSASPASSVPGPAGPTLAPAAAAPVPDGPAALAPKRRGRPVLDFTKRATASASQISTEHATLMTEMPPLLVLLHDCNLTDAKLKKDWKASLSKQLKSLDTMERKLVKHSDKLEQAKSQDAIAQCIWIYIR